LRTAAVAEAPPPGGRGPRGDLYPYADLGYVPSTVGRSVSLTTEYAADDWALANLAAALGEADDAALLDARSRGYRALYDPSVGFLRARTAGGTFVGDPDPLAFTDDYAEANGLQSMWMAQHDVDGLAALLGGPEAAVQRLDAFFTEAADDLAERPLDDIPASSSPRLHYWHGNEPDIHAAYLFVQLGRGDLTQRWVRWIMDELYDDGPGGLAGNDDGGTLSAWWVASALGLYPVPGSDRWVIGAPRFSRATVATDGGQLVVEAGGLVPGAIYVQSVTLGGEPLSSPLVRHADLLAGGVLRFEMGSTPGVWP
jgi:predicted alpha-1,2-mannosidase